MSPASTGQEPTPSRDRPRAANRWLVETDGTRGPEFAERFASLEAEGTDVHGEAAFVDRLLAPGSCVVDAGCGTGRVARELARRGHRTHGMDLDASMLAEARRSAPELVWTLADLLDVELAEPVDAVVAAGNVMVYLTPGTEPDVVGHLAGWLRPGGLLVVGFAADRHVSPQQHDRWCAAAGLVAVSAHSAWEPGAPPLPGAMALPGTRAMAGAAGAGGRDDAHDVVPGAGSYAVLVHRRPR